jgi:anti-sigma B factor antagonist
MELRIGGKDAEGFECVSVIGECDLYNAPRFSQVMLERLAKGAQRVRIDMSEVSYLDSTGIGSIIKILQAARTLGRDIRFAGITGSARKVLIMSNIISLIREDNNQGSRV